MRSTRLAPLATTLLLVTLGVTACGDDSQPEATTSDSPAPATSSTSEPSGSPSDSTAAPADRTRIDIAFKGDSVTPNGDRVSVPLGEEFDLVVTADAPGSLHVHATPELELAYKAGTTTLPLTVDQPGVVEVESHELDVVVVQLEVR